MVKKIRKDKSRLKKLRKPDRITAKRNILKSRINKTDEKGLEEIESLLRYGGKLDGDFDWDYAFLLKLVDAKLSFMEDYFSGRTVASIKESRRIVKQIEWARSCLKILIFDNTCLKDEDIKSPIYVNTRNQSRFLDRRTGYLNEYLKSTLRYIKAKRLLLKIFDYYMGSWWD